MIENSLMREQRRKGAVKSSSIQLSRRRHGSVYIYKVKKEELVLVIPVHVHVDLLTVGIL